MPTAKRFRSTIGHNVSSKEYRQAQRTYRLDESPDPHAPEPRDYWVGHEDLATLTVALKELPLNDLTVLRRFYFDGMSCHQIGQQLGIAEAAAKTRIHRARAKLKRTLLAIDPGFEE
ncbi:MAG: sigma-70 family RNA polymerase sigma factor [bacterium]|nr:sigma-70 family RNA polymerase sigma factor [bacterium]